MRWGTEHVRFARPIRWLVAMYNKHIIPFEIANVQTSNVTHGHRFLGECVKIDEPMQYENILLEQYVVADPYKREQMISSQFEKLENEADYKIKVNKKLLLKELNLLKYQSTFF